MAALVRVGSLRFSDPDRSEVRDRNGEVVSIIHGPTYVTIQGTVLTGAVGQGDTMVIMSEEEASRVRESGLPELAVEEAPTPTHEPGTLAVWRGGKWVPLSEAMANYPLYPKTLFGLSRFILDNVPSATASRVVFPDSPNELVTDEPPPTVVEPPERRRRVGRRAKKRDE